jgi:hypothetical protein
MMKSELQFLADKISAISRHRSHLMSSDVELELNSVPNGFSLQHAPNLQPWKGEVPQRAQNLLAASNAAI